MALKFDECYTLNYSEAKRKDRHSCSSSSQSSNDDTAIQTLFPGWGKNAGSGSTKLDEATLPTMTYMKGQGWNPKTRAWTLWTLRDPMIQESWKMRSKAINGQQELCIGITKLEFLKTICRNSFQLCSEFPQLPPNTIVLRGHRVRTYRSDGILNYGDTFVYSSLSDTITIETLEVGFGVGGKEENKMATGIVKVKACGGLAQLLAACVKPDDIFVIVGRKMEPLKGDFDGVSEVILNSLRGQQQDLEPLTVLRLSFDVMDQSVRLMERINHHDCPGYFTFKYACRDITSGYAIDLVRFRTFSWSEGPERAQDHYDVFPVPKEAIDNFDMPITREAVIVHIYSYLLAHKFNCSPKRIHRRISSSSGSNISSPTGSNSSGYTTEVYASPAGSFNELTPVPSNFEQYAYRGKHQGQMPRKVTFSRKVSHHFSTDDEEDESFGDLASTTAWPPPVKRHDSIGIKFFKVFCTVICPVIVLIIFALSFNPVPRECTCNEMEGPIVPTMERNEYSDYNNYNYDAGSVDYGF